MKKGEKVKEHKVREKSRWRDSEVNRQPIETPATCRMKEKVSSIAAYKRWARSRGYSEQHIAMVIMKGKIK